MTELLTRVFEELRALSEHEQDAAAILLFAHLAGDDPGFRLTDAQVAEIRRRQVALASGATQPIGGEEADVFWARLEG